jgi:hypothetical protein
MRLSKIYYRGSFGKATAEAAAIKLGDQSGVISAESENLTSTDLTDVAAFAVVLSDPDVFFLEAVALAAGTRPWLAAFPFERHIVVTPVFFIGRSCAYCFVRRWLGQPPAGYQGEVVLAIATLSRDHSLGGYRNLSPLAAPLAAQLLAMGWVRQCRSAMVFDTAGLHVESADIRPLHGCRCRSNGLVGSDRFAKFGNALDAVLNSIHTRMP